MNDEQKRMEERIKATMKEMKAAMEKNHVIDRLVAQASDEFNRWLESYKIYLKEGHAASVADRLAAEANAVPAAKLDAITQKYKAKFEEEIKKLEEDNKGDDPAA